MLLPIVQTINAYLSDYVLVILLILVGLWYTIRTGFIQIRCFGEGLRSVFGNLSLNGKKHEKGMSSFQALATAIAAQVGTGNIVGASGAILTGGPGAIFWMWVIAFFGMATIYASKVPSADSSQDSSQWPSSWLWDFLAVWYSPTPSVPPCRQLSAFLPGSWASSLS